jgi:hypothetical protein
MNLGALVGKQSGRDLRLFRTPTQVNAKGATSAAIYPTHLCGLVRIQTGKLTKHVHEARYNPCHPLVINDLRPVL